MHGAITLRPRVGRQGFSMIGFSGVRGRAGRGGGAGKVGELAFFRQETGQNDLNA